MREFLGPTCLLMWPGQAWARYPLPPCSRIFLSFFFLLLVNPRQNTIAEFVQTLVRSFPGVLRVRVGRASMNGIQPWPFKQFVISCSMIVQGFSLWLDVRQKR